MAKERHSIGAVAKRTGISVKTLRFYADEGIVPPSGRSESGILNGRHPMSGNVPEWRWVVQALLHHLHRHESLGGYFARRNVPPNASPNSNNDAMAAKAALIDSAQYGPQ